jgi:hypothetical protein
MDLLTYASNHLTETMLAITAAMLIPSAVVAMLAAADGYPKEAAIALTAGLVSVITIWAAYVVSR